jgi:hypothetical protein
MGGDDMHNDQEKMERRLARALFEMETRILINIYPFESEPSRKSIDSSWKAMNRGMCQQACFKRMEAAWDMCKYPQLGFEQACFERAMATRAACMAEVARLALSSNWN